MTNAERLRRTSAFKNRKRKAFSLNLEKYGEYTCEYCSLSPLFKNPPGITKMREDLATVDHFIPLGKGGTNDILNLRVCCQKCNNEKGNKLV